MFDEFSSVGFTFIFYCDYHSVLNHMSCSASGLAFAVKLMMMKWGYYSTRGREKNVKARRQQPAFIYGSELQ